ncbi:LysR family transcriptional regulator [Bradyrhizobium sp. I71]|uniref:LysR substrate-binding domain-containing protein n=1 Tax=Bradyrhizobium sp. I71 TaxID=2590772 RepID=UPI001EF7B7F3|nr:LysR family transcriptional regulator [Bradyrhizobium sp. I71]ULK98536.1 LysR family transcriptional regulator [Bradyrhizobium sp. I71]
MSAPIHKPLNGKCDLKHLHHAVTAAEYGSFRQAAEALNIKQSTLSRSILQLEHAASVRLFERSPGGAAVSIAGSDFIRMARAILEQTNELFISKTTPSRNDMLRVGICTSLSEGGLRANLLDFHTRFPTFRLAMVERRRSRLSTKLHNGTLDVVISTGRLPLESNSISLWSERIIIALPNDHRLADRDHIYWTDLRSETLLISHYDPYWEFEDLIMSKLVLPEDRPRLERHDVSRSILKSLISMKLGLALMLESDVGARVPSIVFKELRDGGGTTRIEFSAFWREPNDNLALAGFLQLLRERYPSPAL